MRSFHHKIMPRSTKLFSTTDVCAIWTIHSTNQSQVNASSDSIQGCNIIQRNLERTAHSPLTIRQWQGLHLCQNIKEMGLQPMVPATPSGRLSHIPSTHSLLLMK